MHSLTVSYKNCTVLPLRMPGAMEKKKKTSLEESRASTNAPCDLTRGFFVSGQH